MQVKKKHYYLDFALFCREGNVAIETDGDLWHLGRPHSTADNKRQNDLTSSGWHILRFDTHEIREEMASCCIRTVKETINKYKGLSDDGLVPRKFYTAADGSTVQQLTLFEAQAEYDLD